MTPYLIEKAIADYLAANWTYTDIRLVNSGTTPSLPFIECYCKAGQIFAVEIGGAGERYGVFIINIFTPLGVGVQQGGAYGGKLEELFWHKNIDGVVCENGTLLPYTEDVGVDAALQAYHHKTIIPFFVIEEK
jgi:hypothetical protein